MRIIAGSAKGSQIFAPKGQDTRPTQDRVRESLFNILQGHVEDAHVLDLFAGSGALSLEAISRGAKMAAMVDQAQDAMVCIQRNIAKLGFGDRTLTLKCDWKKALARLSEEGYAFDLVFLDPPYRIEDTGEMCDQMADIHLLRPEALMVIEHRKDVRPTPGEAFAYQQTRLYRDTEISFFTYTGGGADE